MAVNLREEDHWNALVMDEKKALKKDSSDVLCEIFVLKKVCHLPLLVIIANACLLVS